MAVGCEELREMASNDYAYQLSKDNSYNIDDLITVLESGWKYLERYAKLQFPYEEKRYFDKSKHHLDRLVLLIDDVLFPLAEPGKSFGAPSTKINHIELLNLAASDKDYPYTPVIKTIPVESKVISLLGSSSKVTPQRTYRERLGDWSKDKRKLKKAIKKLTSAFVKSSSVQEVFENIADNKNIEIFKKIWIKPDFSTYYPIGCQFDENCLTEKIKPKIPEVMGWLEHGTKNKTAFEEALWNCLWLYMKPSIDWMSETKINIQNETPIYMQSIDRLNNYISFGCPEILLNKVENGFKPIVILRPQGRIINKFNTFDMLSVILLIQPAFDLSQRFQQSFPKPRLVTQCHAPSCGKWFYTQDKRQVVCGSTEKNKTSDCRKEWFRYRRWLKDLKKNPEKDWNNPKLIIPFLQ